MSCLFVLNWMFKLQKRICRVIVEILAIQRFQPDVSLCQVVGERRRDLVSVRANGRGET